MRIIKQDDYLKIKPMSLVADYDYLTLIDLYQPIIGYAAVSLYLTLYSEIKNGKISSLCQHFSLLDKMQINMTDLVNAKRFLEATGLIRTYYKKDKDSSFYQYNLYAPKTPMNFFENTLLYGLLIKTIGEDRASKLKECFIKELSDDCNQDEEVTASFIEVFHPDLDDPSFSIATEKTNEAVGRKSAHIKSDFSYERFFEVIKDKSLFEESLFSKKELKEIERIALLYGLKESDIALSVISLFDTHKKKGSRIDFEELTKLTIEQTAYVFTSAKKGNSTIKRLSSSKDLAQKINLMESTSPADFLKILQNGISASSSDLDLLNLLSKKYNLPNGVINAIIDYVLTVNDNILNKRYVEKVAGSIIREDVKSAIEAIEYLKRTSSFKKVKSKEKVIISKPKEETKTDQQITNDETLDWDDLIKEIESGDKEDGED